MHLFRSLFLRGLRLLARAILLKSKAPRRSATHLRKQFKRGPHVGERAGLKSGQVKPEESKAPRRSDRWASARASNQPDNSRRKYQSKLAQSIENYSDTNKQLLQLNNSARLGLASVCAGE